MPCDKCGKHNCNGKCGISPSVLQINNNNCTLFHRVDVPAAMGDEKVNPPKTGAYRNVLLYYEASGNSYLYSSDGIPTKLTGVVNDYEVLLNKPWINGVELIGHKTLEDLGITGAISGAVAVEKAAREAADTALSNRITANTNAITAETTARQNADTALSNRITTNTNNIATNTANIATNTSNIAANTTAIANEVTARKNADTSLSNRISSNSAAITSETIARQNADTALGNRIDGAYSNISAEATARENADDALSDRIDAVAATASTAVQPDDINRTVMTDISVDSSSSSTQVKLKESKVNLKTGATSSQTTTLPVASSTTAGVMNAATYDAVSSNTSNINAILGGAVAINGLPASPSQSALTSAWQAETGLSTLINRASIYDVTNSKVWTYYTNDNTWYATTSASTITINTFTNTSEGVIKGSTADGQVFAENDGTGSVNGWDALTNDVANATSKLANIQDGAEVNVQANWNETSTSSDAFIKNKPTIGDATLTIQKNGTNVQTFTANSTSNKIANITVPTKTSELTNDSGFIEDDTHAVCDEGSDICLEGTTVEPLEFHNVGGDATQQTYSGKNLINLDDTFNRVYPSGLTYTQTPNSVDMTANITTGAQYARYHINLDASKTYTLSGKAKKIVKGTDGAPRLVVRWRGSNDNGANWSGYTDTYNNVNPTQGSEYDFSGTISGYSLYEIYFYNNQNTPVSSGEKTSYYDIQLEQGDQATDFEPYVGGVASPNPDYPQDINVVTGAQTVKITGRNLFDKSSAPIATSSGTTASELPTGIRASTTVASTYRNICYSTGIKLSVGQTITLSSNIAPSGTNNGRIALATCDAEGNNRATAAFKDNSGSVSYTLTEDKASTPYIQIYLYSNLTSTTVQAGDYVDYTDLQLELGNTATTYEPYQAQSYTIDLGSLELAKIGTYQDYIWNDNGTWKIHKEVGKVVLDGSETGWAKSYGGTPNFFYRYREIADYAGPTNTDNLWMSDKMTLANIASNSTVFGGMVLGSEASYRDVRVRYGEEMSTSDWKAYLATNPITIYYASNTPTDTEITDSELIEQLNALWEADGYDGATSITVIPGETPAAILSVCQYPSHLPVATKYKIGAVVVGHGLDIEPDGRLDVVPATENTIGGIKVGENLSITEDGVLSADAQHIDVDSALSTTSENPVQNKVVTAAINSKQDTLSTAQINATNSGITSAKVSTYDGYAATIAGKADASSLATVATSGSYNDLTNKPTIPAAQVNSDWNASSGVARILNKPALATVATSGSYNDLSNKPVIPTVNNATLTIQKNGTTVKTFTANASSNVTANITVPTKTSELTNNSGFITGYTETDPVFSASPAATITAQDIEAWTDKSDFSGNYNDLTNKPTIPTVNNATLTIQKNGAAVQTFTANSSSNKVANITVPVITLTNTDPGEGGSLAANNFIGVYI